MSITKLKTHLAQGIKDDLSYLELRALLIDFKELGGDQKQALAVLEGLQKTTTDESMSNKLLELMEMTEGQGIKALRVW